MTSLWFVVPAAGRLGLTAICLRQLRRTCDALQAAGVDATAVVVADDENLDAAAELGFATFGRRNTYTSRKFNDGIQLACDPALNPRPADYAVPLGSDDWVDWRLFLDLPARGVLAFRRASFVREDGREILGRDIDYTAGVGMRVYPRRMLEACGYRPADEERVRGCDTSIFVNLSRELGGPPPVVYGGEHHYQFVDWKTTGEQLNSYTDIKARFRRGLPPADPFDALADTYPADALEEMAGYYQRVQQRPVIADHEGGLPLYEVLRAGGYRGHRRGHEFTARLPRAAEQRAVERGDIRLIERNTPALQPGSYTLPRGWANQKEEAWLSASH